jgi:hypothetical protein
VTQTSFDSLPPLSSITLGNNGVSPEPW